MMKLKLKQKQRELSHPCWVSGRNIFKTRSKCRQWTELSGSSGLRREVWWGRASDCAPSRAGGRGASWGSSVWRPTALRSWPSGRSGGGRTTGTNIDNCQHSTLQSKPWEKHNIISCRGYSILLHLSWRCRVPTLTLTLYLWLNLEQNFKIFKFNTWYL